MFLFVYPNIQPHIIHADRKEGAAIWPYYELILLILSKVCNKKYTLISTCAKATKIVLLFIQDLFTNVTTLKDHIPNNLV